MTTPNANGSAIDSASATSNALATLADDPTGTGQGLPIPAQAPLGDGVSVGTLPDGRVVLVLDVAGEGWPSSTGDSTILASSGGAKPMPGATPRGLERGSVVLQVLAYGLTPDQAARKRERAAAKRAERKGAGK